jgi:hypothetical protein
MNDKRTTRRRGSGEDELDRRLMEEINLLRLEGTLFCFDPREAKRRRGTLTLADARKQPVSVHIHPEFGQPSVLAYKVLQAIFLKLAEQGCVPTEDGRCLYHDTVSFSQRELAYLVGRTWSGRTSQQLYEAVMQLQRTLIIAHLYDKQSDQWALATFYVTPSALFAGRGETITRCMVRLAPEVMASLNRRHVAFFNLRRLSSLETIGLVLYKRVFFHLSNLMHEGKRRGALRYTKDYEAICREWLGGLKALRHRSKILQEQLGRHLEELIETGLIRRYALEKNVGGTGFNLTFYPGQGFFEDYEHYYQGAPKPRRLAAVAELEEVKALELVAHFHRALGHSQTRFEEHETAYADELLTTYSDTEIRDLIAYAVERARESKFDMLYFGALKRYAEAWRDNAARRKARVQAAEAVASCPFCNEAGYLELKEHATNRILVHPCPHQLTQVTAIEEKFDAYRV